MNPENTFRTKTGYCHLLPEKIVFTRDGVIGTLAQATSGKNIYQSLILYGITAIGMFYFAFNSYQRGETLWTLIMGFGGLYLINAVIRSRNHSATSTINRTSIVKTEFQKGIPGLTRGRFVVEFKDTSGNLKKRLIMLPGTLAGNEHERDQAIELMEKERATRPQGNQ